MNNKVAPPPEILQESERFYLTTLSLTTATPKPAGIREVAIPMNMPLVNVEPRKKQITINNPTN